jgi:hypothetical protein
MPASTSGSLMGLEGTPLYRVAWHMVCPGLAAENGATGTQLTAIFGWGNIEAGDAVHTCRGSTHLLVPGAEDPRWPLSDGARQRPRAGKADYLAAAKAALASSKSRIFFSTL